jgi:hypothetical protein
VAGRSTANAVLQQALCLSPPVAAHLSRVTLRIRIGGDTIGAPRNSIPT